jgi:hypothetical protein
VENVSISRNRSNPEFIIFAVPLSGPLRTLGNVHRAFSGAVFFNQERSSMKKLVLASVIALGAWGITLIPTPAQAGNCDNVRCQACPAGTVWSPIPSDCCRCLPV